jgi:multidrug efflux pump
MGVVPLVLSSGAGSEMRQAIGIAVFFGMLGVTVFGLVLTPVFYVVMQKFVEARRSRTSAAAATLTPATSPEA